MLIDRMANLTLEILEEVQTHYLCKSTINERDENCVKWYICCRLLICRRKNLNFMFADGFFGYILVILEMEDD